MSNIQQCLDYWGVPFRCSTCHKMGHLLPQCPRRSSIKNNSKKQPDLEVANERVFMNLNQTFNFEVYWDSSFPKVQLSSPKVHSQDHFFSSPHTCSLSVGPSNQNLDQSMCRPQSTSVSKHLAQSYIEPPPRLLNFSIPPPPLELDSADAIPPSPLVLKLALVGPSSPQSPSDHIPPTLRIPSSPSLPCGVNPKGKVACSSFTPNNSL